MAYEIKEGFNLARNNGKASELRLAILSLKPGQYVELTQDDRDHKRGTNIANELNKKYPDRKYANARGKVGRIR